VRSRAGFFPDHGIGPDRAGDVFQVLLAEISELNLDLAMDSIVGGRRNADAAGFCNALKPCRNVNSVSEDVMGFDDYVADVDADAESNTPVFRIASCKFMDAGLELHSSSNRFDRTRKLRKTERAINASARISGRIGLTPI